MGPPQTPLVSPPPPGSPPSPAPGVREHALTVGHPREVELLLCCARVEPGAGAPERIRELVSGEVDWSYFLGLVSDHGVWSLVHRTLARIGSGCVPAVVAGQLRSGAHATAALARLRIAELAAILEALEAHGIVVLAFKGVALGAFAYGSPLRRKPGDLDLLVRRKDFERARELLVARGYRPRVPVSEEARYLRTRGASTFEHPDGNVDLHWTLEQRAFDSLPFSVKLDDEGVWERSVPVDLGGVTARTLSAEDALRHLCAHGARHVWPALYAVCDVAEVVRASPTLDWARVTEDVQRTRSERTLHLGLLLAHGLLDAELPEDVRRNAECDDRALALACEVSGWLFDPDDTAGARQHGFAGSVRHHRYNASLLERPADRVTYFFLRGLRKLTKKLSA